MIRYCRLLTYVVIYTHATSLMPRFPCIHILILIQTFPKLTRPILQMRTTATTTTTTLITTIVGPTPPNSTFRRQIYYKSLRKKTINNDNNIITMSKPPVQHKPTTLHHYTLSRTQCHKVGQMSVTQAQIIHVNRCNCFNS